MYAFSSWSLKLMWVGHGSLWSAVFVQPASCLMHGKSFNICNYQQTFEPASFRTTALTVTKNIFTDLQHFHTLIASHNVRLSRTRSVRLPTHFSTDQNEAWYGIMKFKLHNALQWEFFLAKWKKCLHARLSWLGVMTVTTELKASGV